jgi:hypothetical protein
MARRLTTNQEIAGSIPASIKNAILLSSPIDSEESFLLLVRWRFLGRVMCCAMSAEGCYILSCSVLEVLDVGTHVTGVFFGWREGIGFPI